MRRNLALFIFLFLFLSLSGVAHAQAVEPLQIQLREENTATESPTPSASPLIRNRQKVSTKVRAQLKLEGVKLQSCQAREAAIKNRKEALIKLVETRLETMDGWVESLRNFYQERMIPAGKNVSNYNDLISEIQAKRTAVQDSLDEATTFAGEFSCTTDDPKAVYQDFRLAMQKTKTGLLAYRKAIKSLLTVMRSVAGSPIPSATPLGSVKNINNE